MILGGLVHIWKLTANDEVITTAAAITNATIAKLVHPPAAAGGRAGVLREPCEGNWMEYRQCSQDELQVIRQPWAEDIMRPPV